MAGLESDPRLQQFLQLRTRTSRRRFLAQSGLLAGGLAVGPGLLAACGSDSDSGSGDGKSEGDGKLVISNWTEYIDEETIDLFIKESGYATEYKEDYNDNDEYFNKTFKPFLGQGKAIGPDIVVPTYWMASRLRRLEWLEELPLDDIPNHANLLDEYLDATWDPGAKYNMPWQSGIAGIAYNTKNVAEPVTSMNQLLGRADLKGRVGVLTEMRDTVGLTMMAAGKDPSTVDVDAAKAAIETLAEATKSGQILRWTGNEYLQALDSGDFLACVAWSGDVAASENPDIEFVVPDEGGTLWYDTMVLPKGVADVDAAAAFMNFVYDPVNAARITESVGYITPVKGVIEELAKKGVELPEVVNPTDETKKRLRVFGTLTDEQDVELQELFNAASGY